MVKISLDNLAEIREKYKDKKIVFCSGSFDLTHAGHIIFFEDCKKLGDILVVAVGNDAAIKKLKKADRPILNESIRLKTIDSLKPVDYSLLNEVSADNPFFALNIIFEKLKPDFYIVNKDAFDIPSRKKMCKKFNIKLVILERRCPKEYENISTTKIIEKIKNLS